MAAPKISKNLSHMVLGDSDEDDDAGHTHFDPEDENLVESAQIEQFGKRGRRDTHDADPAPVLHKSALRSRVEAAAAAGSLDDPRYQGARVTRHQLLRNRFSVSGSDDEVNAEVSSSLDAQGDVASDSDEAAGWDSEEDRPDLSAESIEDSGSSEGGGDDVESEGGSSLDDGDGDGDEDEVDSDDSPEDDDGDDDDGGISKWVTQSPSSKAHSKRTTGKEKDLVLMKNERSEEAEQSRAIKHQLRVNDHLLEARIMMQKLLHLANQLPAPSHPSWTSEPVQDAADSAGALLTESLNELLALQRTMLARSDIAEVGELRLDPAASSSADLDSFVAEYSAQREEPFRAWRDATIEKWDAKTLRGLDGGGGGSRARKNLPVAKQSTLEQIAAILQDEERLIKRTQLRRQAASRIGEDAPADAQESEAATNAHLRRYDANTFDDSDFYQELLRDFIHRRAHMPASEGAEGAASSFGRSLLKIRKIRSGVKRRVDTKASKGRRIRYDIHRKLLNFMPPIGAHREPNAEIYDSLFGKRPANFCVKSVSTDI